MGRSRAQYGEKKQRDRGNRALGPTWGCQRQREEASRAADREQHLQLQSFQLTAQPLEDAWDQCLYPEKSGIPCRTPRETQDSGFSTAFAFPASLIRSGSDCRKVAKKGGDPANLWPRGILIGSYQQGAAAVTAYDSLDRIELLQQRFQRNIALRIHTNRIGEQRQPPLIRLHRLQ